MKKRNIATSAILSGILFVIFCMASTFATGRTFSPASLQGKFGLPSSALSYQLQDDLAIQSLNELKSYPFLTLVFESPDGQVYVYDPANYYYFDPEADLSPNGYFTRREYTLGVDRGIGIKQNVSKLSPNQPSLDIPAFKQEQVQEIRNLFALPRLEKEGTVYIYSFDARQQKKAGKLLTSLNALSHPYPLKMPRLFGLYAGVWTDFKTALVIGSAFLMLFLILFLLAWCPDQVRLKILNWTTTVSNPCNLVSFCQFLIQIGLEFCFAFILLTGYGIEIAYSWQYGLSIVANFELIRLFFVALRWLIQKRKENCLSKVVLIGSAGGMGVSSAASLLLVEQLLMAIMTRQNIQETVFIVLWLILPLSVLWMIVAAVTLQIHIPCEDKSLLEQRDFWKTFMAASLVMAMVSVLVLPPSISLVSVGGFGITGWLAWKKLDRHPASRCG